MFEVKLGAITKKDIGTKYEIVMLKYLWFLIHYKKNLIRANFKLIL